MVKGVAKVAGVGGVPEIHSVEELRGCESRPSRACAYARERPVGATVGRTGVDFFGPGLLDWWRVTSPPIAALPRGPGARPGPLSGSHSDY